MLKEAPIRYHRLQVIYENYVIEWSLIGISKVNK